MFLKDGMVGSKNEESRKDKISLEGTERVAMLGFAPAWP
jgi:hypothetical protein